MQQQQYDYTASRKAVWQQVDQWRRLLQQWRQHQFSNIRSCFCQVEAVETAIGLTEVVSNAGRVGTPFLDHLANANHRANPDLMRLALKLATGAGKTAVMAMLMAWHTLNVVRRPTSTRYCDTAVHARSRQHSGRAMPKFRNLWEPIRTRMPRKGRGKSTTLDLLSLPGERAYHATMGVRETT